MEKRPNVTHLVDYFDGADEVWSHLPVDGTYVWVLYLPRPAYDEIVLYDEGPPAKRQAPAPGEPEALTSVLKPIPPHDPLPMNPPAMLAAKPSAVSPAKSPVQPRAKSSAKAPAKKRTRKSTTPTSETPSPQPLRRVRLYRSTHQEAEPVDVSICDD